MSVCSPFLLHPFPISEIGPFHNLLQQDWTDSAVHCARILGEEPAPTCMLSTRHTFQLVNTQMLRFLKSCEVKPFEAFHKHDLLVCCYDVPDSVPIYLQWRQPQKLDDVMFDSVAIKNEGENAFAQNEAKISRLLEENQTDQALAEWAKAAEKVFSLSSCDVEGNPQRLSAKFFGRCASSKAKKVIAFEPRCKKGRPGDATIPFDTPNIKARSFLKQARRLQNVLWGIGNLMKFFRRNWPVKCETSGRLLSMQMA